MRSLPDLGSQRLAELRNATLVLLETKLLPETRIESLPVFVAVRGGANVGKTTVFNALAGQLISPSTVQAGSTRHPLVFLHEKWRSAFFPTPCLAGVECRELKDPRELLEDADRSDLLFFRFHDSARSESLALIDSPDADSSEPFNRIGSRRASALADLTVFVTTAQKYNDLVLVDDLIETLQRQARVYAVFNCVGEDVVFETLLADLKRVLARTPGLPALSGAWRLPLSHHRHPEEDLGPFLRQNLVDELGSLQAEQVKPKLLRSTVATIKTSTDAITDELAGETEFQSQLATLIELQRKECTDAYAAASRLAFPEESAALAKVLRYTEVGSLIESWSRIENANRLLKTFGRGMRLVNEKVRRLLLLLARRHEGTVSEERGGLEEYIETRDQSDADAATKHAESLRVRIESFLRDHEATSATARHLLANHSTPSQAREFAPGFHDAYLEHVRTMPDRGSDLLPRVDAWIEANRSTVRTLQALSMLFKIGLGLTVAYILPPATGFFQGLFHILKWFYFSLGYLGASYLLAVIVSKRLPDRARFRAARRTALENKIDERLLEPLRTAVDGLHSKSTCQEISRLTHELSRAVRSGQEPEAAAAQVESSGDA